MKILSPRARIALAAVMLVPLALLYWEGASRHGRAVNTNMNASDQSAYMNYAGKMARSGYAHVGDRNRMPVYPFLLSRLYRPGEPDEVFFERGKLFNTALSLLLLAAVATILFRWFAPLAAFNLVVVTAFTLYLFKAAYVQCELLYYTLNLVTYLLMCVLLARPGWVVGLLAGTAAAATHLTKAAALPGVVLFLGLMAGRGVWRALRKPREGQTESGPVPGGRRAWKDLATAAATAAAFLMVLYPYISTSKRVFGRWFYNVNTTFYAWYDTEQQVMTGTRLAGDREGWPKLPAERIPGPGRYLREHSMGEGLARVRDGLGRIIRNAGKSYGWARYFLLFAGFGVAAVLLDARTARRIARERASVVLFAALYFGGYAVLYAWASASNSGVNRLMLQQFLPLLLSLAAVTKALDRPVLTLKGRQVSLVLLFNLVLLPLLASDIHDILTRRIITMYGGS